MNEYTLGDEVVLTKDDKSIPCVVAWYDGYWYHVNPKVKRPGLLESYKVTGDKLMPNEEQNLVPASIFFGSTIPAREFFSQVADVPDQPPVQAPEQSASEQVQQGEEKISDTLATQTAQLNQMVQSFAKELWGLDLPDSESMKIVHEMIKDMSNQISDIPAQRVIDSIDMWQKRQEVNNPKKADIRKLSNDLDKYTQDFLDFLEEEDVDYYPLVKESRDILKKYKESEFDSEKVLIKSVLEFADILKIRYSRSFPNVNFKKISIEIISDTLTMENLSSKVKIKREEYMKQSTIPAKKFFSQEERDIYKVGDQVFFKSIHTGKWNPVVVKSYDATTDNYTVSYLIETQFGEIKESDPVLAPAKFISDKQE